MWCANPKHKEAVVICDLLNTRNKKLADKEELFILRQILEDYEKGKLDKLSGKTT